MPCGRAVRRGWLTGTYPKISSRLKAVIHASKAPARRQVGTSSERDGKIVDGTDRKEFHFEESSSSTALLSMGLKMKKP